MITFFYSKKIDKKICGYAQNIWRNVVKTSKNTKIIILFLNVKIMIFKV